MQVTFELAHRNGAAKTRAAIGTRAMILSEPVTLEIAEATERDAPVAVSWTDREGGAVHTRWYDGRHFRPVETEYDAADLLGFLPPVNHPSEYYPVKGFTRGFLAPTNLSTVNISDRKLEHYDQAARQRGLANASEWARNCLIVDGKMYMACAEPRYTVASWGIEVETNWPAGQGELSNEHRPNTINYSEWFHTERFPLDRREEATATARTWSGRDVRILSDDVTIHIPFSIGADQGKEVLREAAQFMMNALDRNHFDQIPPVILRGVLPITDLIWQRDWDDVDYDLLAEAVDAARSAARRGDPTMDIYRPDDRQRLDEALRRWFDSEITLDVTHKELPKP